MGERAEADGVCGGDGKAAGGFAAEGVPGDVLVDLKLRLAIRRDLDACGSGRKRAIHFDTVGRYT